jgi:hypothetical protein
MSSRLEAFYDKTITELGYRISPRLPLKYRITRLLQRIYDDERNENLSFSDAELMANLLQLSFNMGCETSLEYYTRIRGQPKVCITRLRGYPDGGVSIGHREKTVRHHPMILRSHAHDKN